MAKIKHLVGVDYILIFIKPSKKDLLFYCFFFFQLLAKERELLEKVNTIKDSSAQIATLKSEVSRLRRFEEEISNVQVLFASNRYFTVMAKLVVSLIFSVNNLNLGPANITIHTMFIQIFYWSSGNWFSLQLL